MFGTTSFSPANVLIELEVGHQLQGLLQDDARHH